MVHLTSLVRIFDRVWTLVCLIDFLRRGGMKRVRREEERDGKRVDGKERGGRRGVKREVGRE